MQAAPRSSGQHRDGGREAPSAVAASERPAGMGEGRATSLKMHHGIKPGLAIRFLYVQAQLVTAGELWPGAVESHRTIGQCFSLVTSHFRNLRGNMREGTKDI